MNASVHEQWAHQFSEWAAQHAFGPSTVNSASVTAHMLVHNPIVSAAREALDAAQAKVNETLMASVYTPTPAADVEALKQARTAYRVARRQAMQCLEGLAK